jgi:hypothetical protein
MAVIHPTPSAGGFVLSGGYSIRRLCDSILLGVLIQPPYSLSQLIVAWSGFKRHVNSYPFADVLCPFN